MRSSGGCERVPVEIGDRDAAGPSEELPDVQVAVDPHRRHGLDLVEHLERRSHPPCARRSRSPGFAVGELEGLVEPALGRRRLPRAERSAPAVRTGDGRIRDGVARAAWRSHRRASPATGAGSKARSSSIVTTEPREQELEVPIPSVLAPGRNAEAVATSTPAPASPRPDHRPERCRDRREPDGARCTGRSRPGCGPGLVRGYSFTTVRSPTTTDSFDWSTSMARSPVTSGTARWARTRTGPGASPQRAADTRSKAPSPGSARRTGSDATHHERSHDVSVAVGEDREHEILPQDQRRSRTVTGAGDRRVEAATGTSVSASTRPSGRAGPLPSFTGVAAP